MTQLEIMGAAAKKASRFLMNAGSRKDEALLAIAKALRENSAAIIAANDIDIENGKAAGLTESLLDRLRLDEGRIEGMATGVAEVAALPDPIGKILDGRTLKNGLKIEKVTVPMGVIGIIYEARPNVQPRNHGHNARGDQDRRLPRGLHRSRSGHHTSERH